MGENGVVVDFVSITASARRKGGSSELRYAKKSVGLLESTHDAKKKDPEPGGFIDATEPNTNVRSSWTVRGASVCGGGRATRCTTAVIPNDVKSPSA